MKTNKRLTKNDATAPDVPHRAVSIGRIHANLRSLWRLEKEVARVTFTMKALDNKEVSEDSWSLKLPRREDVEKRVGISAESMLGVLDEKGRVGQIGARRWFKPP